MNKIKFFNLIEYSQKGAKWMNIYKPLTQIHPRFYAQKKVTIKDDSKIKTTAEKKPKTVRKISKEKVVKKDESIKIEENKKEDKISSVKVKQSKPKKSDKKSSKEAIKEEVTEDEVDNVTEENIEEIVETDGEKDDGLLSFENKLKQENIIDKEKEEVEDKRIPISIYNQFIKLCVEGGNLTEASNILLKMPSEGFKTNTAVYNLVLLALSQNNKVDEVKKIYESMNLYNIPKNKRTLSIINDLSKTADLKDIEKELTGELKHDGDSKGESDSVRLRYKKKSFPKDNTNEDIAIHDKEQVPLDLDATHSDKYLEEFEFEHLIQIISSPTERAAFTKQIQLEQRAIRDSVETYNEQIKNLISMRKGASLSPSQKVLLYWYGPVSTAIADYQKKLVKEKAEGEAHDFLAQIDAQKLAVIVMHEVLSTLLAKPTGNTFTRLAIDVGTAVQAEINLEKIKNEKAILFRKIKEDGRLWGVRSVLRRFKVVYQESNWSNGLCAKVGGSLIEILMKNAFVSDAILSKDYLDFANGDHSDRTPAFIHYYHRDVKKMTGMVRLDDKVLKIIDEIHLIKNCAQARYLPMLVPPRPWVSSNMGGYLTINNSVMRFKGSHLQHRLLKDANDLSKVYTPLNILGSTAWTINDQVYDVIDEAWKNGGGIAELPTHTNLEIPPLPDFDTFVTERSKYYSQQKKIQQLNWDRHGLRCETNYKLAVAHEFKKVPFYFPHNIDFRGRAYPIPPYLNQMGNDLCRSLLLFYDGKPLGKSGLNWLKVHLSNLCGNNKISFQHRMDFANENLDNILDSASKPLSGNRWWLKAEEPWQCLATCFEIKKALDSKNPEEYVTHLPVHQDGSCNGLQHYAALGGDILGAEQVNLLPSDKPQDVYSGVTAIVAKIVERDALAGDPLAIKLRGQIVRKILKQTVMTSVYGVTMPGARKQILNAMKQVKVQNFDSTDDKEMFKASYYLAKLTFEALKEMFHGARNIMEWLATCAKLIAQQGKPVYWVTPLGLPVVQPYRKMGKQAVKTVVQTISLEDDNDNLPVSVARQKSAFPPNYVHSLDSTHMMLTAMNCYNEGITFSSVHDSFWCHPSNVERMSEILRDQFIQLHQQPLLDQLRSHFKRIYPEIDFPVVPEKGGLDLNEVRKSTYFFH